ncbi:MAG: hypothetical protein J6U54_15415 [Clostridiales bacterium]|nr:hypothetical protein [Clostridiales bacterium]
MQKNKRIESAITGLRITVDIDDAVAIAVLLNKVDEYEKKLEVYNKWAAQPFNPETGEPYPEPENPTASWDPQDFITKAKNILRQLTFINIGESNVFNEDWMKSDDDKVRARKSYD